ncbi:DNA pilot protein [Microviridae sp.]|nr:DNA pilot protein [Microviridae sp.]
MSFLKTATSAIAGAAGSLLGDVGTAYASARQAKKQMEFQERMSNTAYQRAADDLEAAGLNRILALGSPASTPGGAMGQVPSMGSAIQHGLSAGAGLASTASQVEKQEKEMNKIIQETKNLSEIGKKLALQGKAYEAIMPLVTEGADNFKEFSKMILSPEWQEKMVKKIGKVTGDEIGAWSEVLSQHYNASILQVTDMLERVFYGRGGITRGIDLGPGRVN